MKYPFYDPISERWVTPRQPPAPQEKGWMEVLAESALAAERAEVEAARRARADRIWAITKQVASGCNAPTEDAA